MTDWSWEYVSTAEYMVGGMHPDHVAQVEEIAQRLTDAAGVKYLGEPPIDEPGVSRLQSFSQGPWIIGYQEHWPRRTVYIVHIVNSIT